MDSNWQGDEISMGKDPGITRISFHNVNGMQLHGPDGLGMYVNELAQMDVDIQGVTEHCLDTTKFEVFQTAHDLVKTQYSGQANIQLDSSSEPAINQYKPGGTGLLLLGATVSRQEPQGRGGDPLGRWSYAHLRRKDKPPVTVIAAYQVCPRPTNIIGNTAFHQQVRALSAAGTPNLHPRTAFVRDLSEFITTLQSKGHDIIIGGDFNESLDDKNSGILKVLAKCNLIDPFLQRFPHHPNFGTHNTGNRRIDYVFLSPTLFTNKARVGYAPFQYAKPSDHRPLFLELPTKTLFGYGQDRLQSPAYRVVKSSDKVTTARFISKWHREISDRQGFTLKRALDNNDASPDVVELLDSIIGESGEKAEKMCRRRRPEFYSQVLVQHRLEVSILRGHLKSLEFGADRTMQLQRRMQRGGLEFPLPPTIRLTRLALREAHSRLQQACKDHAELRDQELQDRIEIALQTGQKTKAQIIRAIKKSEDYRKTYHVLQQMKRKGTNTHTIDRIEIPLSWPSPHQPVEEIGVLEDPKTCTQWKMITRPDEVEYYLLLRNRLHFGQAEGTPFTVNPLCQDIDWAATTQEADHLLHGTYTKIVDTPQCLDLLRECRQATTLDSLPAELTTTEFQGKIKSWKESTTTSPSGRHLGWYKALFTPGLALPEAHHTENDTAAAHNANVETQQEEIASLILTVINYCIRHTHVLNRWKKIVNIMIFKEINNFKIHRLRVIHIYEADFNLLLAVKWRQLLRTAENKGLIHEGQYGGRPGCEAQSLTLLEELKYDLSYLTRRTLFNFDNDAASCYDRIVVPFASVINRKYGLHHKVVSVHAKTLQEAQYYLKTSSGESTHHYTTCRQYPIHGTGQGSGNSPSIWLFISSTLFQVHQSLAYGARFVSPDGTNNVQFSMVGFVDDSTGTVNDFQHTTEASVPTLLHRMQHDAQVWNNLLYCSGGKLELKKCSFHVLTFEFRPDGTPIAAIDNYENSIFVMDPATQENIPIPSKRAYETHQTLGHHKAPASRLQAELYHLRKKAERISLLISASPLTRTGAYLAYHTVYNPSMKYTLPQCFFPQKILDQAQASSLQRLVSKSGYNRKTARALLFGPTTYGGGGFLPWYLMQGEGQILQFLKHWRTDTPVSKTMKIATLWAQWQAGISESIFEDPTVPVEYLECRWLTSLRLFLRHISAKIVVDIPIVPAPEKDKDIYIMDFARECGLFDAKDLAIVNYCRLYLHVTTVSELFDASGSQLNPFLFQCRREPWFHSATYITLQKRPSEHQIRMKWQRLCRQWSTASGALGASFDLGTWKVSGNLLRRRRQTYYEYISTSIYSWHQTSYWEFVRDATQPSLYHPVRSTSWQPTPTCIPFDIVQYNEAGSIVTRGPAPLTTPPHATITTPTTFQEYITTLAPWERFLLQDVQLIFSPQELITAIAALNTSRLLAVSDGSQKGPDITYGWVLGSEDGEIFAKHKGRGSGQPTSHRAEGWGVLSAVLFIHHIYIFGTTPHARGPGPTRISFLSDNSGLIHRINDRLQYNVPYPSATLASDWDLVEQIHKVVQFLEGTEVTFLWVKGHQDKITTALSPEAQLNIQADALAESAHSDPPLQQQGFVQLPAARCTLFVGNTAVQHHYVSHIREAFVLPSYKMYIAKRHSWDAQENASVDWKILQQAITNFPVSKVQLTKLIHGKLPTNAELAKSQPGYSSRCHYCDEHETFYHLLTCSNVLSATFRTNCVDAATEYLRQRSVGETFTQAILDSLQRSLRIDTPTTSESAQPCVTDQERLGHQAMLQGFLSLTWRHTLDQDENGIRTTSTDGLAGFVRILWAEQLRFWEAHVKEQNQRQRPDQQSPSAKLAYYRHRVRQLHSLRDKCLPGHQEQYFYPDLENYLRDATACQLRQYLHHYDGAIQLSINAAQSQRSRTLWSFPGFRRRDMTESHQRPNPTIPSIREHIQHPSSSRASPTIRTTTGARGAPLHHRHTRWRSDFPPMASIRNFFSKKTP